MARPGIIAFPVILVLGGITGYLTYTNFTAATPDPGVVESPYWKPVSANSTNQNATGGKEQEDTSKFTKVVTIKILEGSAVQGSPDYDPDPSTADSDALVTWENTDNNIHTATSGTSASDADSGKLFDSKFLNKGDKYSIAASKIGAGEHPFYCQVHPYMTSKITIK